MADSVASRSFAQLFLGLNYFLSQKNMKHNTAGGHFIEDGSMSLQRRFGFRGHRGSSGGLRRMGQKNGSKAVALVNIHKNLFKIKEKPKGGWWIAVSFPPNKVLRPKSLGPTCQTG